MLPIPNWLTVFSEDMNTHAPPSYTYTEKVPSGIQIIRETKC